MDITIRVSASSHPDFALFATTEGMPRQLAIRGDRTEIDKWLVSLAEAAVKFGHNLNIIDETTE